MGLILCRLTAAEGYANFRPGFFRKVNYHIDSARELPFLHSIRIDVYFYFSLLFLTMCVFMFSL